MEKVNTAVIGAGVVGLAVAERLSGMGREVVVLEKNDGFGRETSSRNSEIIHGGLYYRTGSLKATLCVEGRHLLYEFCARHNIPHRKAGKILVANTQEEIEKVNSTLEQATRNGVEGMRILTGDEVVALEPHVRAQMGIISPETGILDTHQLMKCLESRTEEAGGIVAYNCEVTGIAAGTSCHVVTFRDADGETTELGAEAVVNAAGPWSDTVSAMAGIDIDKADYRLSLCKGEYFAVSERHRGKLQHLVYPAPTPYSLGIHAVVGLDGSLKLGPNVQWVESVDYRVDESHIDEFADGAAEYLPFVTKADLRPDQAGVRPKLQKPTEEFRDFVIAEESSKGLPGYVSLVGIESPGLTSCLSIAKYVAELL